MDSLDESTEEGRQKLSKTQGHNLNLNEIWDTKYNDFRTDYDKDINGPKEPEMKTLIQKTQEKLFIQERDWSVFALRRMSTKRL